MLLFNTNEERKAYWEKINAAHSTEIIEAALEQLPADTARVLRLHYQECVSLKEIVPILKRSISVVRNHHNRGIYLLGVHFENNIISPIP